MVSLQTLKEYEFRNTNEYFDYILKSLINGQRKQAIILAKRLSMVQKIDAIEYLESYTSKLASECKSLILKTI